MDSHSTSFDIYNKLGVTLYNGVYQQLAGSIKHTTFRSAETTPEQECLTEAPSTQTPSDDTIISQNDLLARKIGHTAFCFLLSLLLLRLVKGGSSSILGGFGLLTLSQGRGSLHG